MKLLTGTRAIASVVLDAVSDCIVTTFDPVGQITIAARVAPMNPDTTRRLEKYTFCSMQKRLNGVHDHS